MDTGGRPIDSQAASTHTRARAATTATTSTLNIISFPPALSPPPVPPPPSMPALSLPPPGAFQHDTSPLNPLPAHAPTTPSLPPPPSTTTTATTAPSAIAAATATASAAAASAMAASMPMLVQIEQDIAQLDVEIVDLQLKLAHTVGLQAHQKMNDLLDRTTSS